MELLTVSARCYTLRQDMRVLGIDCGGEYTGYGVVEQDDAGTLRHVCSGAIRLLPREALELRLKAISDSLAKSSLCIIPRWSRLKTCFTR